MIISEMSDKDNFEKIMAMARKLKALAERGDAGEKETATSKYLEYLKKHNLNDSDINPEMNRRFIEVGDSEEKDVLLNVILSVNPYTKHSDQKKGIECYLDNEDFDEVLSKFEYFKRLLKVEKELLITAFLTKHQQFFEPDEKAKKKWRERRVKNDALTINKSELDIIKQEYNRLQAEETLGINVQAKVMNSGDRLKVAAFNRNRTQEMIEILLNADYQSTRTQKRLKWDINK